MQFCSHLLPGDRLDLALIEVSHSALDFLGPCELHIRVGLRLETLEQKASELRPLRLGELDGFAVQIMDAPTHGAILPWMLRSGRRRA